MAENSKWNHASGAIQAAASVYCAVWGTWAYSHPYTQSAQKGAEARSGGVAMPLWLYIGILVLAASVGIPAIVHLVTAWRRRRTTAQDRSGSAPPPPQPQSRLKIISGHYGVEGINNLDVTPYLLERLHGHSYAELVGADLFHGFDPLPGNPNKKLTVCYSFDGRDAAIIRPEHEWLILPEDSFLRKLLEECRNAHEKEKQDYANRCLDYRAELGQYTELFTTLQIEAFSIAKDLRDFLASLDPFPSDPPQNPGESNNDYMARLFAARSERQGKWRLKLMHGYANRKFGERVTELMHHAGEEVEYPAFNAKFAEQPPMNADDIRRLAQQMEMVGIWINRKQRDEVDLLHPKNG